MIRKEIKINSDYITLSQLLKIADIIYSGGEAKYFLSENEVFVNGELDTRRGRKLYPNDTIVVNNEEFIIIDANK